MKTRVQKSALLSLTLALGMQFATAFDGLVIANSNAPTSSLSADDLKKIFTGKTKYWDGGEAIVIIYVDKETDDALDAASGMKSSAFKTFWQRLAFSGRATPPKKVDSVAEAVSSVASTKGAIAVVTAGTAIEGVKKIEVN